MRAQENPPGIRDPFTRAAGKRRGKGKGKPRRPVARPFTFRLSDAERALLMREAGTLSLAAHVRKKLLADAVSPRRGKGPSRKRRVPAVDQVALAKVLALLGRAEFSRRPDELATAAVMGALPLGPELIQELHAVCAHIREMRNALMKALNVERGFEE